MRKHFSKCLYDQMSVNKDIILLTGDLGYGLWDKIKLDYPDRFFNVGSSEQLLVGASVGMALEGKIPFVYSITPFLLYRPFEFIRNYLNEEKIPVKLIGGGRDKDYGYLGFSHWAEEDQLVMSTFKNIKSLRPSDECQLEDMLKEMIETNAPYYINLKK